MTKKEKINTYIGEAYKQFVAIKDDKHKKSRTIVDAVFKEVHQRMGENCSYFKKYGRQVMTAGSVYDRTKVSEPNEFDIIIVIRLPISYKDGPTGITIENEQPGFVKMNIGNAFDNLDKQKDWENCHKVTRDWRDRDKYFLQNKFRNWVHGLVQKALNEMGGKATVDWVTYSVSYKESGPAYTLNIRNDTGGEEFLVDVDLVPVIKFVLPRWPDGYREVRYSHIKEWHMVPKPNKALEEGVLKNQCWRLSFQEFERVIMKGCQHLKMTFRLVKKLRDALGLKKISSYYIKTLFLWKLDENKNKSHWEKKLDFLFRDMVQKLHDAIKNKNIPYYWNEKHNLIKDLKPTIQEEYVKKLRKVIQCIDADDVGQVVAFLLTPEELKQFQCSDFYLQQKEIKTNLTIASFLPVANPKTEFGSGLSQHQPLARVSVAVQIANLHEELVAYQATSPSYEELNTLKRRYHELEKTVHLQEQKLKMLESEKGYREKFEALTKTFHGFINNAVSTGLMPVDDSKPTEWEYSEDVEMCNDHASKEAEPQLCYSYNSADVPNRTADLSIKADDMKKKTMI